MLKIGGIAGLATTLLLGILSLEGQDGDKGAYEFHRVNSKMDTWYQVKDGDEQIGFAHTAIDPYGKDGLIEFVQDLTAEFITGRHRMLSEKVSAKYRVTEADNPKKGPGQPPKLVKLDFASFEWVYSFGGSTSKAVLDQSELKITLSDGTEKTESLKDKANLYFHPDLALLALVQQGTLMTQATHRVSVVVPTERGLALQQLDIRVIGPETRRYMGLLSRVIRVTVDKPPEMFNIKDWYIDSFGRVLEYHTRTNQVVLMERDEQWARLPAEPIDTWYRVVLATGSQERTVGFMRSLIKPVDGGIEVTERGQINVGLLEAVYGWYREGSATLDGRFEVSRYEALETFAQEKASRKVEGTAVRVQLPGEPPITVPRGEKNAVTVSLALLGIVQRGELFAGPKHTFKIVSGKTVEEIELEVVGATRREFLGVPTYVVHTRVFLGRHKVAEKEQDVYVDMYTDKFGRLMEQDAPLEPGRPERLRLIVSKDELDAKGLKGEIPLPSTGQRNPFDKWMVLKPVKPLPKPPEAPNYAAELAGLFRDVDDAAKQLLEARDEDLARFVARYENVKAKFWEKYREVPDPKPFRVRQLHGNMQALEERMQKELEKKWEKIIRARVKGKLEQLKEAIEKESSDRAKALVAELEKELTDAGVQKYPDLVKEVQEAVDRARKQLIIIEVKEKMRKVEVNVTAIAWEMEVVVKPVTIRVPVTGIEWTEPVRLMKPDAYAVIDGRVYTVGDPITVKDLTLSVGEITKDTVKLTFTVGKETLEKTFYLHK